MTNTLPKNGEQRSLAKSHVQGLDGDGKFLASGEGVGLALEVVEVDGDMGSVWFLG